METMSISDSSIYTIGDTHEVLPRNRVIAVQKEGPPLQEDINFEDFPLFQRRANFPSFRPNVRKKTVHHDPNIYVQQSAIIAVNTSSILHIGNLNHLSAESRIKHFRLLLGAYH